MLRCYREGICSEESAHYEWCSVFWVQCYPNLPGSKEIAEQENHSTPPHRITHTPQRHQEEKMHKVTYCMLQGNHGGKEVVPGSSHWFGFLSSHLRAEPKKGTQHEFSLAENFSEPIGLKQFHHGIPEHEKAELCTNIVMWEVRARHLLFGKI